MTVDAIAIVELTDENRPAMFRLAMSMYLGEKCRFCHAEFTTLEELHGAVYAGYSEWGRVAHKACWDANNPPPPA